MVKKNSRIPYMVAAFLSFSKTSKNCWLFMILEQPFVFPVEIDQCLDVKAAEF